MTERAVLSDGEASRVLQADDPRGFERIVLAYHARLYALAYRLLGDADSAADAVQDTFIRAWRKRRSYDPRYPLSTWLFTICANLSRTELRRRTRWRSVPIDSVPLEDGAGGVVEVDDSSAGLVALVERALPNLPPKYRRAFVLRDMEGMPYDQMAEVMDVPLGTVKSRVNRARLMMRELLAPHVRELEAVEHLGGR